MHHVQRRHLATRRETATPSPSSDSGSLAPMGQWGFWLLLLAYTSRQMLTPEAPSAIGAGFTPLDFMSRYAQPHLQYLASCVEFDDDEAEESEVYTVDNSPSRARRTRRASRRPTPAASTSTDEHTSEYDACHYASSVEDDAAIEIEDEPSANSFGQAPATGSLASTPRSVVQMAKVTLTSAADDVIINVLEFLSIADIEAARRCSTAFERSASMIAPQPFGPGITFVRLSGLSSLPKPLPNPHALPAPFTWRCIACGGISNYHESCVHCGTNIRQSGCRLFVGQVRKQHSARTLTSMLHVCHPEIMVRHIESHSNKDGYEKGAAWMYLDNPADAATVAQLNKRVFFDVDANGEEGFWLVDNAVTGDDLRQSLFEFATIRKGDDARRQRPLPGQPLVVEAPDTSMLFAPNSKPNPLRNSSTMRGATYFQPRNAGGWQPRGAYYGPAVDAW